MDTLTREAPQSSTTRTHAQDRAATAYRRITIKGWLLSLPSILVLIALAGVSVFTVIIGAFSPEGFGAFQTIIKSPRFGQMMANTGIWVLISLVGAIVVGYLAALALNNRRVKFTGIWRSLLLIPWITPTVAAATAWKWIFSRDFGTLNGFLQGAGIINEPISWLTDPYLVLPALAMVQVWCTFPFVMLMVTSGLQAVPDEIYEAAQLDGANWFHTLRYIVLPALRDVTFILILIVTVWALNSFIPVWVITKGGPAGASTILPIELYQAFQNGSTASISVIALFQLLISMTLAWFYVRQTQKDD
ncbi:carbohydrate ABC transporter permease [Mycetocola spongiae]|uniref:carbohydrate ABC transporter permease n=1 Tax=Mycetocola spongiae TaxID=2859226 RepID=UPI001CF13A7B|nr:sugar ABC transporter permease [Mycetocola spongiae]UCR88656.1 sugar ABC transporter permease [Mycetocola spongiae]